MLDQNPISTSVVRTRSIRYRRFIKKMLLGTGLLILSVFFIYICILVFPRSTYFSYGENPCIFQPLITPSIITADHDKYSLEYKDSLNIGNVLVFSKKLCISQTDLPKENSKHTITLKLLGAIPIKIISIQSGRYPSVDLVSLEKELPLSRPLNLSMSSADSVFSYRVTSGDSSTNCNKEALNLICRLDRLNLEPGTSANMVISRNFNNQYVETIFDNSIKTLDALAVTGGNTSNGKIIFDNPEFLEIEFNKALASIGNLELVIKDSSPLQKIEVTTKIIDKRLLIKPLNPLRRQSTYLLRLSQATSTEDHTLASSYITEFTVAGGPSVASHNTGKYGFSTTEEIVLKFSQNVDKADISNKIKLTGSGIPALSYVVSGSQVKIKPSSSLPSCTRVTIIIDGSVKNIHGISGDSEWKHSFKTLCRRTSSIGYSAQGRSIATNWYGSGPNMVLYVGGIHGNEKSSVLTMQSWLDELERNSDKIPADKTIVVIPNVNPDGYIVSSRFNSRRVDLNRNFPSISWAADVSGPGYSNLLNGGGTAPLSEPETSALASFVNQYRPRLVLSYHASASIVSPNTAGDSDAIARLYDSKVPYRYADAVQTDSILGYSTSGDFEFWLRDIGIPNLLIEQSTLSKDEFAKNKEALWAMTGV